MQFVEFQVTKEPPLILKNRFRNRHPPPLVKPWGTLYELYHDYTTTLILGYSLDTQLIMADGGMAYGLLDMTRPTEKLTYDRQAVFGLQVLDGMSSQDAHLATVK